MCVIGIHGIEVSVPSTRDFSLTSWVLISGGKNRFVNQMEDPSISHNVPSSDLLREQANSKEEESSDDDGASGDGQALLIVQVPSSWGRILLFSRTVQCIVPRLFLLRTEF